MNKLIGSLLVVGFFAVLVTCSPPKIRDTENVSVSLESIEKDENSLEGRIKALKAKVNLLIEQGKENENAFKNMEDQVQSMKTKVKLMTEKLKKINKVDYLNTSPVQLENL